jgi:hypothetical protein
MKIKANCYQVPKDFKRGNKHDIGIGKDNHFGTKGTVKPGITHRKLYH